MIGRFKIRWWSFIRIYIRSLKSLRPTIDGLDFACLDETKRISLEKEFDKEEILVGYKGD